MYMEKRLILKINEYQDQFKSDIKTWIESNPDMEFNTKSDFLKFIYDYDSILIGKEDFIKRKRIKSFVPHYLRCNAKRANGEQCTRKKKDDSSYCGTHDKNRPHGIIDSIDNDEKKLKKVSVWPQEICGIIYYIDADYNVYKSQDIISNIINPKIIAKYKIQDDKYTIIE